MQSITVRVFLVFLLLPASHLAAHCPRNPNPVGDPAPPAQLMAVDLSADAKRIAASVADGTVILWDVTTGQMVPLVNCHEYSLDAIAFSPDSSSVALGYGDGLIQILQLPSGQLRQMLRGDMGWIQLVAFSADGKRIAALHHHGISVWSLDDEKEVMSIPDAWKFTVLMLNHDGTLLVTGGDDGKVRLWDVSNATVIRTLELGPGDWVNYLTLAHNDEWVMVAQGRNDITVWNATTGEKLKTLRGHTDDVGYLVYVPETSTLLSVSDDNTLRSWDLNTGKVIATWKTSPGFISADGKFVLRANKQPGLLEMWRVGTRKKPRVFIYVSPWGRY
jgi:WD40 repeat protein